MTPKKFTRELKIRFAALELHLAYKTCLKIVFTVDIFIEKN